MSADAHGNVLVWSFKLTSSTDQSKVNAKGDNHKHERSSKPSTHLINCKDEQSHIPYALYWSCKLNDFALSQHTIVDEYGLLATWGSCVRYLDFREPTERYPELLPRSLVRLAQQIRAQGVHMQTTNQIHWMLNPQFSHHYVDSITNGGTKSSSSTQQRTNLSNNSKKKSAPWWNLMFQNVEHPGSLFTLLSSTSQFPKQWLSVQKG